MNHKDLDTWDQAMRLAETVYQISSSFPKHELYGLTSQMRRAAVSIPSNISEGAARRSKGEFRHFLHFALGSLAELETQIILADRLNYAPVTGILDQLERVRALIHGLRRSLS